MSSLLLLYYFLTMFYNKQFLFGYAVTLNLSEGLLCVTFQMLDDIVVVVFPFS